MYKNKSIKVFCLAKLGHNSTDRSGHIRNIYVYSKHGPYINDSKGLLTPVILAL